MDEALKKDEELEREDNLKMEELMKGSEKAFLELMQHEFEKNLEKASMHKVPEAERRAMQKKKLNLRIMMEFRRSLRKKGWEKLRIRRTEKCWEE